MGYADEPAEAAGVAAAVRDLLDRGVAPSEVAVLYRINAQSEVYEDALTALGIPYVLRGGERFFERPEVKQAVLLLRGAARASEATGAQAAGRGRRRPGRHGVGPGERHPLAAPPASAGSRLAALVRLAEDFASPCDPTPPSRTLVAELDERSAAQHAPTVEGVTLASLHAAKGLEWDAVFLVGLVDGMVPIVHAQTVEAVEEERRLLYVGVTRAREHLALSWSWARNPGGSRTRQPSRFLDGLRPGDGGPGAGRAPHTCGRGQGSRPRPHRPQLPDLRAGSWRPRPSASAGAATTARRTTTSRSTTC